jgi:cytidylate kinase
MKYKNIAVSGKMTAAGSTTLAWKLAKELGWQFYSAGEIFRQYCQEKGWPIERYQEIPDKIDKEVDKLASQMLKQEKHLVYEGWLAGWIAKDLPDVFRILCLAPLKIRIKRFAKREGVSLKEAREKVVFRDKTTVAKHQRLYLIKDQFDQRYFNLVLETDKMTPEEEVRIVRKKLGNCV